jgi:hypothetical protein
MNAMSSISSSKMKVVCNKEDVILLKDDDEENKNKYRIIFNAHNSNFPIKAIVGLKLYTLLYELNRDIIHTFKIVKEYDATIETLLLFKPFGKDFGISPKCMHTISTMNFDTGSNACIFDSVDIVVDSGIVNIPKKYERIQTTHSKLIVYFISEHDLQFDFTFHLNDHDDDDASLEKTSNCPIYMENSVGLMIKKMFCRLKVFTERMS